MATSLFGGNANYGDEFKDRNERLAKSGGLSMFSDLKTDLFGGKSTPSHEASDIFAELTRQQWADFQQNVLPYQDKLIEFGNSTTAQTDAMTRGIGTVDGAFDRQTAATSDRLRGLGLSLNADEQKAAATSTSLSKSLAEVQGANQAGIQTRALQQAVLGNPTPQVQGLS
jgi:hypothetical protein